MTLFLIIGRIETLKVTSESGNTSLIFQKKTSLRYEKPLALTSTTNMAGKQSNTRAVSKHL